MPIARLHVRRFRTASLGLVRKHLKIFSVLLDPSRQIAEPVADLRAADRDAIARWGPALRPPLRQAFHLDREQYRGVAFADPTSPLRGPFVAQWQLPAMPASSPRSGRRDRRTGGPLELGKRVHDRSRSLNGCGRGTASRSSGSPTTSKIATESAISVTRSQRPAPPHTPCRRKAGATALPGPVPTAPATRVDGVETAFRRVSRASRRRLN